MDEFDVKDEVQEYMDRLAAATAAPGGQQVDTTALARTAAAPPTGPNGARFGGPVGKVLTNPITPALAVGAAAYWGAGVSKGWAAGLAGGVLLLTLIGKK